MKVFQLAVRDLVQYVTKMAEEGWDFICITSLSSQTSMHRN